MEKIHEFFGGENVNEIAYNLTTKNENQLYAFIQDWTGEKYVKLYKFNIEKFIFEEV